MRESTRGRIGDAGIYPKIDIGIVSPAGVQTVGAKATPKRSCYAGPDCRVIRSAIGRVASAGICPGVRAGIVPAAGVQGHKLLKISAPRRSFHCRSRLPCDTNRPSGALAVLVAVHEFVLGLYLPPVFGAPFGFATPDDHFAASPNCGVRYGAGARWCWWLSNYRCWGYIRRRC